MPEPQDQHNADDEIVIPAPEDVPFGELHPGITRENLPEIGDIPPRLAIDTMQPQSSINLMAAQAEYLVALTNYIHDHDLKAIMQAQEVFINAQATYIHLADDRLLAEVQEQIIGVQLKTLRKLGAV